jgi:CubicO group peptidase (beta-lactamase class C family)
MKRRWIFGLALVLALLVVTITTQRGRRAVFMGTLFQGFDMRDEFASMESLFPIRRVRTEAPSPLPRSGVALPLPEVYDFDGESRSVRRFLEETDTSGLVVLRDGQIVHEEYALGSSAETHWISWSVAKSFVSALVGIAVAEGRIASVRDPVTRYVPELAGSAYDGVAIEDVLEMSSGAAWDEDYGDPTSDITRFGAAIVFGFSQDDFAASLRRDHPPGTYNRYNSTDTQVLGMLLVRVTGMTLAEYTETRLWKPLHMEHDAYWITDERGMELAFGGLNATLRDYARFGELYRNAGRWHGRQLVPVEWVRRSTHPTKPHLQPGRRPDSENIYGYGYQWWLPPESDEDEYSAIGVYNQFVYVNPTRAIVIAKTSANRAYGKDESTDRELETLAVFHQIAQSIGPGD